MVFYPQPGRPNTLKLCTKAKAQKQMQIVIAALAYCHVYTKYIQVSFTKDYKFGQMKFYHRLSLASIKANPQLTQLKHFATTFTFTSIVVAGNIMHAL